MGALPSVALGATPSSDVAILNFALTLEYLEAAFYTEAVQKGALTGEAARFAAVTGNHERAHVAFLKKALGRSAVKSPRFNFKGTTANEAKFLATATVLEDTGVMAYSGQGPLLKTKAIVATALSILTVEARHAAQFRQLNGQNFAPAAFDNARPMKAILRTVGKTGFIKS